ncbi:MAG TPA: hypothetical protein VI937_02710 [Negativicutes bacterium]|nr:hypothetical protein [Negativicutes bacterium]
MPFTPGNDPLFHNNESSGPALPHHDMPVPPSMNPPENPQAPEPKQSTSFSGRDYSKGNPLTAHKEKEVAEEPIFFEEKYERNVSGLEKEIGKKLKELTADERRKMGFKGDYYKASIKEKLKLIPHKNHPDSITRNNVREAVRIENKEISAAASRGKDQEMKNAREGKGFLKWLWPK